MKVSLTLPLIILSKALLTESASSSREVRSRAELQNDVVQTETVHVPNGAVRLPKSPKRQRKWLSNRRFGFVKSEKFSGIASKAVTCCQYGIIAYLVAGIFKDIVSSIRELSDEFASNNQNALSRREVKELISWITKHQVMAAPVPSISLPWLAPLALNLYTQTSLSISRIEHILESLKVDQANILHDCLLRSGRKTTMESVGGLAAIKENINDWIDLNRRHQFELPTPYDNFIESGRRGLALWGPPGCGKSLLMKAIADKSRLPTLVVTPSLIQNKYYGESTKRVRSLFSLVALLGPCVVVLDELDGLFKSRNGDEMEVSRDLKTEWLQWWDGVAADQINNPKVLFVGATNRPWDCDPAVWRRLPQRHYVGVPTYDDRLSLFQVWVNSYKLPSIDYDVLEYFAGQTEGYISSDLYHILQSACRKGPMERRDETLTIADVQRALAEVPETRFTSEYVQHIQGFLSPHGQAQQHQNPYESTNPNANGGSYFETPTGNYYQFQVPAESSQMSWSQNQNDFGSDSDEFDSDDFITDSDFDEL